MTKTTSVKYENGQCHINWLVECFNGIDNTPHPKTIIEYSSRELMYVYVISKTLL